MRLEIKAIEEGEKPKKEQRMGENTKKIKKGKEKKAKNLPPMMLISKP